MRIELCTGAAPYASSTNPLVHSAVANFRKDPNHSEECFVYMRRGLTGGERIGIGAELGSSVCGNGQMVVWLQTSLVCRVVEKNRVAWAVKSVSERFR